MGVEGVFSKLGNHPCSEERVAPQIEEKVILDRNGLGVKEGVPGLQDSTFSLVSGKFVGGAVRRKQCWLGEGRAIQLAAGKPGQSRDRLDKCRNHVSWQTVTKVQSETIRVYASPVSGNNVTDELLKSRGIFTDRAGGREDARFLHQHGLYLG